MTLRTNAASGAESGRRATKWRSSFKVSTGKSRSMRSEQSPAPKSSSATRTPSSRRRWICLIAASMLYISEVSATSTSSCAGLSR
ncbi:hypothetical protein D3C75_1219470 [compost metagenome]